VIEVPVVEEVKEEAVEEEEVVSEVDFWLSDSSNVSFQYEEEEEEEEEQQ
jgi:hypothetical protein